VPQPRIVKSLDADRDLDALFDYIACDSGVDRAEAILRRIDETLFNLAVMPRIGRIRHDLEGAPRVFSVWPWLILYEPLTAGTGIVDGRRDLTKPLE
jgi:plasmid stabilization system protein ParE